MEKDIVLVSGALATPKLWHHQENYFKGKKRFHHIDILNTDSIVEMARRYAVTSPEKFILVGFSMGGLCCIRIVPPYS